MMRLMKYCVRIVTTSNYIARKGELNVPVLIVFEE